jgi:hypothetical protein
MVSVRLHPDAPQSQPEAGRGGGGGRLNLLLSYAGWEAEPWVDRLPLLLEPMGVHSVRAESGQEASRVLRHVAIHIAVVDLALPLEDRGMQVGGGGGDALDEAPEFAEGGPRLLELLARLDEPPPVVAIKRGRTQRVDARDTSAALKFGAFAIVDRPRVQQELDTLLEVLRRCLERHYHGRWPGQQRSAESG